MAARRQRDPDMKIHDASTVLEVPWPDTWEGHFARQYLVPLVREGTETFFSDRVDLRLVELDDLVIPIAINDGRGDNSTNCSIFARYIRIPLQALPRMSWHPALSLSMRGVLSALGALLRAGAIEKCIFIGNGLIVRGMEPIATAGQVARLTEHLLAAFPEHALVFDAVNPVTHHVLLNNLRDAGYSFLFAGHTRMLPPHHAAGSRRDYKRRHDARLLESSGYELVDGAGMVRHAPRLAALYKALNRDKYSTNPLVKEDFFALALRDGFIRFRLLRKDDRIDGFIGHTVLNDVLYSPVFGYDTSVPQSVGLYRMVSALTLVEAMKHRVVLESGAGADDFKSHRGDLPVARYAAFFVDHLPPHRRAAWRLLQGYANGPFAASTRKYLAAFDGDEAEGLERIPAVFASPCEMPRQAAAGLRREVAAIAEDVEAAALDHTVLTRRIHIVAEKLRRWPYALHLVDAPREQLVALEQRVRDTGTRAQQAMDPAYDVARKLLEGAAQVGRTTLVTGTIDDSSASRLRAIANEVRGQLGSGPAAVLLAGACAGKALLLCVLSQDLVARDLSASALLEAILPIVAGRGGGEAAFASGGGRDAGRITEALEAGRRYLAQRLQTAG
jgi:hypothetical protein